MEFVSVIKASTMGAAGGTANFNDNQTAPQLDCGLDYRDFVPPDGEIWCNWAWDSILCWPPTKASTYSRRTCPRENGMDPTKFVEKRCGDNGQWEGREGSSENPPSSDLGSPDGSSGESHGWTNYTPCFTPEMRQLLRKLYAGSEHAAQVKLDIAEKTRTLEIVGFSVSLAALLVSLAIFCHFRNLRNTRTRIHKNLFVAMVIQVVIRLTLYIDQALLRKNPTGTGRGIENTPFLCEASYVLLEYARTAMFMWMFIEGLYLHSVITVTVFQDTSYYRMYRLVGWGYPVLMTLTWAVVTAFFFHPSKCWWGYNLTLYFWILEGPRMAVILDSDICGSEARGSDSCQLLVRREAIRASQGLIPRTLACQVKLKAIKPLLCEVGVATRAWSSVRFDLYVMSGFNTPCDLTLNFLFLLNIIRVLVVKLRQSHTSEIEQVRKAVRAAAVLLPLLGITNLISMADAPLDKAVWEFALWSYSTHFLTSFQGLFVASLYCFLNGEVRLALGKAISTYISWRGTDPRSRRQSTLSGCQTNRITTVQIAEVQESKKDVTSRRSWTRLCCRGSHVPVSEESAETRV